MIATATEIETVDGRVIELSPEEWTAFVDDKARELLGISLDEFIGRYRAGQPEFPHLHVNSQDGAVQISKRNHVPTGEVSLSAVTRFLIEELGVRPRRDDWASVLTGVERESTATGR